MHDKTVKSAIPTQPRAIASRHPDEVPLKSRTARPAAPHAKVGDKAAQDVRADDTATGGVVQGPHTPTIDAPQPPRKVKSNTLSDDARGGLVASLMQLGEARLAQEIAAVAPGEKSELKEPSILEFTGEKGDAQRWVISNTLRQGSFGKFRIAVLDTPEGAPLVVKAIKEYRLDDRRLDKKRPVSIATRRRAIAALDLIKKSCPDLRHYCVSLQIDLKDFDKPINKAAYNRTLRWIEKSVESRNMDLPDQLSRDLNLRPKTAYVSREAITAESALFPLAGSPLQVVESVELDGRVYNFSALMRGELADVTRSRTLSEQDRKYVVRDAAREGFASLAAMHEAQIVHRDLKPANILLDQQSQAQMGDWNLAKQLVNGKTRGPMTGTPNYLSPEMYDNVPYGTAADVYSMGLSLAKAALNRYLIDEKQSYEFEDRDGAIRSTYHEALDLVISGLQFDNKSVITEDSLSSVGSHLRRNPPPYSQPQTREVIVQHAKQIVSDIKLWHARDPNMCGPVLNHTLRRDPDKRLTAAQLTTFFADLQPADSAASQQAREVSKKIMAKQFNIEAEVARLQVYAKAYKGST